MNINYVLTHWAIKKNFPFFNRCRRLTVVHKYEIRATIYAESIAVESEEKNVQKSVGMKNTHSQKWPHSTNHSDSMFQQILAC